MKKIIVTILILMITAVAFASNDVTIRVGGAFDLLTSKTPDSVIYNVFDNARTSLNGFGFDVGVDFDLSSNLQFYVDFSKPFPPSITIGDITTTKAEHQEYLNNAIKTLENWFDKPTGKVLFSAFSVHVGFSRIIKFEASPLTLTVGGGFGIEQGSAGYQASAVDPNESEGKPKYIYFTQYQSYTNISLDLKASARYFFGKRFAVYGTITPGVSFFNINKQYYKGSLDDGGPTGVEYDESIKPSSQNTGFALGFNLGVRIGVSYTF